MLNLGPTTRAWLVDLGLEDPADILARDPIDLALACRAAGHPASLNLVYALAGARLGLQWNHLPDDVRLDLFRRWNDARQRLR